jgi:uncharacterized protein involved in outer membrane biogenesis
LRRLTRLVLALGVVAGLGAGALGLYVASLEIDVLRDPIAYQLSRALGRDVSIARVVEWGELLRPRLVLEDVVVASTPAEGGVELARVERAVVGLDLVSLLRGVVRVETVTSEGVSLTIDVDSEGHWIWAAARGGSAPDPSAEGFDVEIDEVDVERAQITYHDSRTGETAQLALEHLSVSLSRRGIDLALFGNLAGRDFDLEGEFVPEGGAVGLQGPFEAEVQGRIDDVEVELRGHVETLLELHALDVEVSARGIDLPVPPDFLGGLGLAPATLSGRLQAEDGALSLRDLTLEAAGPGRGGGLQLTGEVSDLTGVIAVDLEARFEGPGRSILGLFAREIPGERLQVTGHARGRGTEIDLDEVVLDLSAPAGSLRIEGQLTDLLGLRSFEGEARVDVNDTGPLIPALAEVPSSLRGTGRLQAVGATFRLEDLDVHLGDGAGLALELRGAVFGSENAVALDLDAELHAPDLSAIASIVGRELPELGPLSGTARLRGSGWDLDIEDLDLDIGGPRGVQAVVAGDVRDLGGHADARLRVRVDAPSSQPIGAWLGRELPELGRVELRAALDASKESVRVEAVSIKTSRADGLSLSAEGELHGASLGDEVDLSFGVRSPQLTALGELADTQLPALGPVWVAGRLYASRGGDWTIQNLSARLGETDVTGSVTHSARAGRGRLLADLSADEVQLDDLIIPGDDKPEEVAASVDAWRQELPVFPLPELDLDLTLRVGSLEGRTGLTVEGVSLYARLDDRVLTLSPLEAQLEGAPVQLSAGIDARSEPPRVWLRASGDEVDLAAVAAQLTDQDVASGRARVRADLSSQGRTPAELLDSLGGEFSLVLRDGRIATGAVLLLQKHLLRALAFRGSVPTYARAECLVADFTLAQGVASTRTLLVDGTDALLHGSGSIDLKTGTLDLLVTPKAKRPRLFAVLLPVHVTGRYDDPVTTAQKSSLAGTAALAFVGNLLVPGVGLLAPFVQLGSLGSDPCAEAVEAFLGADAAGGVAGSP